MKSPRSPHSSSTEVLLKSPGAKSPGRPRCDHMRLCFPKSYKDTKTAICLDTCGIRATTNGKESKVRLCNECGIWENYK